MKLWMKVSTICICVFIIIIGISSTLLILMSKDNILKVTLDSAVTQQHSLQSSFSEMLGYYGKDNMDTVAKSSMVKYCFSRFADSTSVLVAGDQTIYSNVSILPEKTLKLTSSTEQQHYIGEIDGRNILIVGSKTNIMSEEYSVYTVRDITSVYNSIDKMILKFVIISFVCIVVGVVLITFLVRFSMRPLKELSDTARYIAKGEYNKRVKINTKDEVGALAQDFNDMAKAVQVHIDELNENAERQLLFIGGLTHEFKTPLTSVIGHSETLLYTKMPEEVVLNSLSHIHEQCKRLERLTQKLLRLITLQEQIELKEESVDRLLENVKDSVEETLKRNDITLQITCQIDVLPMDFDLMLSMLINLVDNGVKASKAGQNLQINAYENVIEVTDQGIGISKEEISRIMEPFYMVDPSRNKVKGGSGLGLALVKKIGDAHGAEIVIESTPGQGTKIKVIFPVYI